MADIAKEPKSVITLNKLKHSLAGTINDQTMLRGLFVNPLLVSALILLVIWLFDFSYGKTFNCLDKSSLISHVVFTYVVIVSFVYTSQVLIKHKYRIKVAEKQENLDKLIEASKITLGEI